MLSMMEPSFLCSAFAARALRFLLFLISNLLDFLDQHQRLGTMLADEI
jgi:hypothetical protein